MKELRKLVNVSPVYDQESNVWFFIEAYVTVTASVVTTLWQHIIKVAHPRFNEE